VFTFYSENIIIFEELLA